MPLLQFIRGSCGLLFTDKDDTEVRSFFQDFEEPAFARSGFTATKKFSIPAGLIENAAFSLEPQLRKLGLKTQLQEGTSLRLFLAVIRTLMCF